MHIRRIMIFVLVGALLACLGVLRHGQMQSAGMRRVTNTTEEGINLNPSISGDGRIVAFESTEDVAGAGDSDHFRAIRANVGVDPATFFQMAGTRAVTPAISQDGSRIAFSSKDDPLGTNSDGNSEIFLFDGAKLIQVTNTSPGSLGDRVTNGNFQPSISDDGRFIAFSSNRDLASQNADNNFEVFVYDASTNTFSQLTNSSGVVGFTDAKISGDGATVAFIRDQGTTASSTRDLVKQPRVGPSSINVLAAGVQSLAMTYGRAISDDGLRVVYSGQTPTNTTQVFMFDGRAGGANRQITSLGARVTEVPLHPTISGDGSRIAFAARRSVPGATSNSDGGVELYVYDLPTSAFSKITNAPSSATADVVSSLNDDGSIVTFNFPRIFSGAVTNAGTENNSEIYVTAPPTRPANGTLTAILNDASFGHEPSTVKAVAPNSIAAAQGTNLANTTSQSSRLADGTFPTNVAGTRVTVNGRAAQIFFVSSTQVNFLVPPQTEIGTAEVIVTNSENFPSRGTVPTLRAAPGIFTKTGDGIGAGLILNSDTLQEGPFDPTSGNLRLTIFTTGARNAIQTTVSIGGRVVNAESIIPSSTMPGLDEVHVRVPSDLRGAGTVNLSINSDGRDSNPVAASFLGDASRAILINEVLADPPAGDAGDANHDGLRDGTQDEFIELVNGSAGEAIGVSGWTIKTRATGSTTETTRFTFASGTSLPAGESAVIFGGGAFNPTDPVFGCAQVFKATSASSGLSLTNGGLTVLVHDSAGNLIAQFSYGGLTGLDGGASQSLTRSPDITGSFVLHTAAVNANGRKFSPGLQTDGTPFGNCPGKLSSLSLTPANTTIVVGQTTQFIAKALDQYGRTMTGISISFASDNTNVATIDSSSTTAGVATVTVRSRNPGTTHITATATDGTTAVNSSPSTLAVTGPSLSINDVTLNEGNSGTATFAFTVSLSTPAPAPVTFDIATQDNTATVADNDYVARSLTAQTIPAGQQTYSFDVTVNGDVKIEQSETFFVNVTNVTGASVTDGQGLGTIISDDIPRLSVNDVSLNEGNSGATTFAFIVSSSLPAPAGGITFDIATADGTATAGLDYVARSLTGQTIPAGQTIYTFNVNVNGDTVVEPNETFLANISNVSSNAGVADGQGQGTIQNDDVGLLAISQVYGGGDNSGAPFRNDFVELYNRGTTTVDFSITPYSVQYAGVGSNFSSSNKTNLRTGSIAPGKYFLIQEAGGTTNGVALPTPDASGSISMGSASGKVALVAGTTALAPATCPGDDGTSPFNPNNASIADFVGYGNSATTSGHCYEGAGPAAALSNTTADFRKAGGCVDTNDNAADFFTSMPSPRNSSATNNCAGGATPNLSINDVTIAEGNSSTTTATFTISLSAPAQGTDVTFDVATADGTATTMNSDYIAKSLTNQVIPAGVTTYTFSVTINGDTNVEPDETFLVNVSNVVGANVTDGQGRGTIQNDDLPAISINDVSVSEGNSGATIFDFTVSLSAAAPGTVTFDIATADGTATTADLDYVAKILTNQTIAAGQQTYHFLVSVNGDTNVESNETFFVNLTNVTGATVADSQGQGTILNDDSPILSINSVSITEGNAGTTNATFTVTLLPVSNQIVTVQYATADGTAKSTSDYQSSSGTLTFNPGDTTKPIDIPVNGDLLVEQDEVFTVSLSNPSANASISGTNGTGTGTIQNDDTALVVISQVYGGGGNTSAPAAVLKNDFIEVFNRGTTTVDLAGWSVQYSSASGTGSWSVTALCSAGPCLLTPGKYFLIQEAQGTGGTTNLPTADATGTIAMATASGKVALVTSTSVLSGSCPSGATILDQVGYGGTASTTDFCFEGSGPTPAASNVNSAFRKSDGCTDTNDNSGDFLVATANPRNTSSAINDCNAPPTLRIDDVSATEGNSLTKTFTFTVSLSKAALAGGVSFDIATQDNSASAGSDYVAKTLTSQTIAVGQQTYTFDVTINGDMTVESDETLFVNVTNVTGATVGDGQGLGTIQNDDSPSLSIDDVTVTEGNSGTTPAVFTVTLNPSSTQTVTVNYATSSVSPATAAAGTDYVTTSGALTFNPGDTTKQITVQVNGDTANEAICETYFVKLSSPVNATILDDTGQGGITDDDGTKLVISQVYGGGGNSGATYTNDFIEIFNRGATDISLNGWSVQYAPATGTTGSYSVTALPNVTLQPGHYYLIQEASGGAVGSPLPSPDLVPGTTIDLSASAGRVALVNGTTALSRTSCPTGSSILDFVGYGSTAICREGSTTSDNAGASSATTSDQRKLNGCQDAGINNNDFSVLTPNPRNTSTATNICSCGSSYSSLLILGDSWQNSLAMASVDRLLYNRGW